MELTVFEKVKTIFVEFVKKGLTPVQLITEDLVEIVSLQSTGVHAEVRCIFCSRNKLNTHGLPKKHIVQCEVRGPNLQYWNYGNLKKHIKIHMKTIPPIDELSTYIQSLPVICDDKTNESVDDSEVQERIQQDEEHVQYAIPSTYARQPELYNRFLAQKINLVESNLLFNEQKNTMVFKRQANNQKGTVEVVKIQPTCTILILYDMYLPSQEGTNNSIKRDFTLRERIPLNVFKVKVLDMVHQMSMRYDPNEEDAKKMVLVPQITNKVCFVIELHY